MPRFWANNDSDDVAIANLIRLGMASVCFGAIHCIAWSFSSTYAELLIWRLSSIAMTSVPIYIPLKRFLSVWLGDMDSEICRIVIISVLPAGILYIIARAATLVHLLGICHMGHTTLDHLHTSCIAYFYICAIYGTDVFRTRNLNRYNCTVCLKTTS